MNPAHPDTLRANAKLAAELDFSDRRDFEDAERGFIATLPDAHIEADAGGVSWSMKSYGFLSGEAPETVNPSLWRMSQLNAIHGLFKVGRARLPGARLLAGERHFHRRRDRRHRRRSSAVHRTRARGDRAVPRASRPRGRSSP